jgi:general secretion pathway protein N
MSARFGAMVFGFAFICALLLNVPLRLALPDGLLSARSVSGTIWSGRIDDANLGGLAFGKLDLRLRLDGWMHFSTSDQLSGISNPFAKVLDVDEISGSLPLSQSLDLAEHIDFQDTSIRINPEGCAEASGMVHLQLAKRAGDVVLGQRLTGTPRCKGRDLVATLASRSRMENLTFILRPDKSYVATVRLGSAYVDQAQALTAQGFVADTQGYLWRIAGHI